MVYCTKARAEFLAGSTIILARSRSYMQTLQTQPTRPAHTYSIARKILQPTARNFDETSGHANAPERR
jgi:hypothetical protein